MYAESFQKDFECDTSCFMYKIINLFLFCLAMYQFKIADETNGCPSFYIRLTWPPFFCRLLQIQFQQIYKYFHMVLFRASRYSSRIAWFSMPFQEFSTYSHWRCAWKLNYKLVENCFSTNGMCELLHSVCH